ncbi:MAG TPA: hypothetical protein VFA88_06310 [Gaiellaceae bacterium]|nr:hypothetical protein [Gaiellaceae bacterium]
MFAQLTSDLLDLRATALGRPVELFAMVQTCCCSCSCMGQGSGDR